MMFLIPTILPLLAIGLGFLAQKQASYFEKEIYKIKYTAYFDNDYIENEEKKVNDIIEWHRLTNCYDDENRVTSATA
jgi:hypothetical protein